MAMIAVWYTKGTLNQGDQCDVGTGAKFMFSIMFFFFLPTMELIVFLLLLFPLPLIIVDKQYISFGCT